VRATADWLTPVAAAISRDVQRAALSRSGAVKIARSAELTPPRYLTRRLNMCLKFSPPPTSLAACAYVLSRHPTTQGGCSQEVARCAT
jgi:hypothetical protein